MTLFHRTFCFLLINILMLCSASLAVIPDGPFFGQTPPGTEPELFAPGIVPLVAYAEPSGTFSPDGNEFFFTVVDATTYAWSQIWYTTMDSNGHWSIPAIAPFSGTEIDYLVHFSPDGQKLFFCSGRPPANDWYLDIFMVERTETGWSEPVALPFDDHIVPNSEYASPCSNDGTLYYQSWRQNPQRATVYVSEPNGGQYLTYEMFDTAINDEYNPVTPCIAPDESYMLFGSNIETGGNLADDLYIIFKTPNGGWTHPQKLGPGINTSQRELIPRISGNGKYLFFDRRGYGFYWADISVLDQFRAASNPSPADQDINIDRNVELVWEMGHGFNQDHAFDLSSHDMYLGTSFVEVNDANQTSHPNVDYNNVDVNSYTPGLLMPDTFYYWRVDEVNGPNTWKGPVWRFKTGKGLSVEDFDSYADNTGLRAVWEPNLNSGSEVSLEIIKVQSSTLMKYGYEDIGSSNYYSEVDANTLDLPSGIGRDWTIGGVKALALYFYGQTGNSSNEPMYVRLTDADSDATVTYGDNGEDTNDIKEPWWQEWNIALADFAGVDLNNVKKITIGFGDKAGPDAEGNVYFDDIRLYMPRCVPDETTADVNGDCFVDYADIEILTDYWLVPVSTTAPCDANLIGRWVLEDDVCDSSGYNNNGILNGNDGNKPDWVPGRRPGTDSKALKFLQSDADYVNCGTNASLNLTTKATVAAWIQTEDTGNGQINSYVSKGLKTTLPPSTGAYGIMHNSSNNIEFFIYQGTTLYSAASPVNNSFNGVWHHVAGTYDGSQLKLYIDGQLKATTTHTGTINTNTKRLLMGASEAGNASNQTYYYDGKIDEVWIYSRVLSQAEIMYLAEKHVDLYKDGMVNLRDFASLAAKWLEEELWPQSAVP